MIKGGGGKKRNKKKVTIKETTQGHQKEEAAKDEIEDLTAQWIDASLIRKPNG